MQLISISNREGQAVTRLFKGLGDLNNYLAGQGCLDGTEIKFWADSDFYEAPIPFINGSSFNENWMFVLKHKGKVDILSEIDDYHLFCAVMRVFEDVPDILLFGADTLIDKTSIKEFEEKLEKLDEGRLSCDILSEHLKMLQRYAGLGLSFEQASRKLYVKCIIATMANIDQESFSPQMKDYLEAGLYWFETQGIELPKAL